MTPPDRLLTTQEAAEYLSVGVDWLKKAAAARRVPHTRLGKYVRFSPSNLAAIISEGETLPVNLPTRGSARSKL